ncbi:Uncharacterised protein [BD1-7 clade bacterium]|uniref:DUF3348 domain-containing protein n=1 Tax=BD1-7 clade bacterium TaxID=2029982 RepID=A0A5S9MVI9_9GAMM|nr:Uncharacterised protein [BD1-7 clade bacterium]
MAQGTLFDAYQGSRLVRVLSDLTLADTPVSHKNFALRLGEFIDLSDAFALSDQLRSLPRLRFKAAETADLETLKNTFMAAQSNAIDAIMASFVPMEASPGSGRPMPLPRLSDERFAQPQQLQEAYHRFYTLHQSDMEGHVLRIRHQIKEAAQQHSEAMMQLNTLDNAVSDALLPHQRKLLTIIPRLMNMRFQQLLTQHQQQHIDTNTDDSAALWQAPGQWLAQYHQELQSVMLAELELRFLPVLGMIEAMENEESPAL